MIISDTVHLASTPAPTPHQRFVDDFANSLRFGRHSTSNYLHRYIISICTAIYIEFSPLFSSQHAKHHLRNASETTRSSSNSIAILPSARLLAQIPLLRPNNSQIELLRDRNRPVCPAAVSFVDAAADYAFRCLYGLSGDSGRCTIFVLRFGREFREFSSINLPLKPVWIVECCMFG